MTISPNPLLHTRPLRVINIGAELFAEALRRQDIPVVQVRWTPPRTQDPEMQGLLDALL